MTNRLYKILVVLLGMALGVLASVVIATQLVQIRAAQLNQIMGAVPTTTKDVADPAIYSLLARADQNIQAGNLQAVIDSLAPVIETWQSDIDKTTGYQLLAVAELRMQHPQKAIPYAKKMTELTPGSFSFQILAVSYDESGDLLNALAAYQQMMMWSDNDSRSDFNTARARIISISRILGTDVPSK